MFFIQPLFNITEPVLQLIEIHGRQFCYVLLVYFKPETLLFKPGTHTAFAGVEHHVFFSPLSYGITGTVCKPPRNHGCNASKGFTVFILFFNFLQPFFMAKQHQVKDTFRQLIYRRFEAEFVLFSQKFNHLKIMRIPCFAKRQDGTLGNGNGAVRHNGIDINRVLLTDTLAGRAGPIG